MEYHTTVDKKSWGEIGSHVATGLQLTLETFIVSSATWVTRNRQWKRPCFKVCLLVLTLPPVVSVNSGDV